MEQVTRWQVEDFSGGGFVTGAGLLGMVPGGAYFSHSLDSYRDGRPEPVTCSFLRCRQRAGADFTENQGRDRQT